jgi:hypothetical protein
MGFQASTANTRIHPFRDYSEHEVINLFSKDVTGVAGELVKILRSSPSDTNGFSNTAVGASFDRVTSLRYETKDKITKTVGGENRNQVLGFTLNATLETDENGIPLKYNPRRKEELQAVISGEAVPVVRRGEIMLYSSAYVGTPTPGYAVVPFSGGDGKVHFVDASNTGTVGDNTQATTYKNNQVIGTCLSSSGSELGGYALISLNLL